MAQRKLRIALVAGETSGDMLGAGLMRALLELYPNIEFEGIGGPRMAAEDCKTLYPMERLAVTGLTEVLGRLRELLGMRRQLAGYFIRRPPDVFIGIDAPDFNLGLEQRLREAGIPVVHYVSPSVWAWRQYRVRKIARSVDLMLTLFPFETEIYRRHGIPVACVGHPMADEIDLQPDPRPARERLGLPDTPVIALLPGSRENEVRRLGPLMLQVAQWCLQQRPQLGFVAPMAGAGVRALFERQIAEQGNALPLTLYDGNARELMRAADAVLLASGTATLEAMLLKKPMVVCYRLSPLSFWLMRQLVKVEHVSLPNLLAGRALVPELLQRDATPENLGRALLQALDGVGQAERLEHYRAIHRDLRKDASRRAAERVLGLIGRGP